MKTKNELSLIFKSCSADKHQELNDSNSSFRLTNYGRLKNFHGHTSLFKNEDSTFFSPWEARKPSHPHKKQKVVSKEVEPKVQRKIKLFPKLSKLKKKNEIDLREIFLKNRKSAPLQYLGTKKNSIPQQANKKQASKQRCSQWMKEISIDGRLEDARSMIPDQSFLNARRLSRSFDFRVKTDGKIRNIFHLKNREIAIQLFHKKRIKNQDWLRIV